MTLGMMLDCCGILFNLMFICYDECMKIRKSEIMKRELHNMAVATKERRDNMKERMTIRQRGQVTLPKSLMEKLNLSEGDSLELTMDETGEIKLVPLVTIPADQRWFWTKGWQEGENEAEEDKRLGRTKSFDDIGEALNFLDSDESEKWANKEY